MTTRTTTFIFLLIFWSSCPIAGSHTKSQSEIRIICEAQELLTELGFSPGSIDGIAGLQTQKSTTAFLNFIKPSDAILSDQVVLKHLREHHDRIKSTLPKNDSVAVGRPYNGQVFQSSQSNNEIAPLEIRTPVKGYDFFVKLSDIRNNKTIKTFYIREGSKITTKVPLGIFNIKYVTGKKWLSENCLFGINTIFSKAEKAFKFKKSENQVSGYSVELILQIKGNLSTSRIPPSDW